MPKSSDFRVKEVINIRDGRRLGTIIDMEFNLSEGRITAIIVPGSSKWMGLIKNGDDIVIPWERIKKIGDDVILVDIEARRYP
ncbi:MAG: YlmC/YmxH family sporulation protein [Caldicoprobacterales bacterium]|nr:YlmC/YmxH family sporulation protein [Clostridia bacterium]MDI9512130.1 YlmC/YmxH family sporulation protein [Bacillota bacterium]NLH57873.1 YlmC/YmxH family sporulation protein [Clostridiales bacterium]